MPQKNGGPPPIIRAKPGEKYTPEISNEQIFLIGRLIISWSFLEQAIEELIWRFLCLPVDQGRIITSPLDAKYKINMLRGFGIKHLDKNSLKEFHRVIRLIRGLYAHRSTIAHGVWVTLANGKPAALSLKTKVPEEFDQAEVITTAYPPETMITLTNQILLSANYFIDLGMKLSASPDK